MKKGAPISAVLALCVALALALSACGSGSGSGSEGGTLKATFASFPDYMDPGLSHTGEGWTSMYNTYIPLLTYAHASGQAGSQVIPGLAKAMPKISDGGKTYALTLRKGLKYSDGKPVKASDFAYTIERVFKLNSSGSPFYTDIVGAEQFAKTKSGGIPGIETDDKSGEIVIHLVKPRGTFTNELGLPFAAPVPAGTPDEDLTANPPPATGPYAIAKSQPGRGWEYERNPQWAKANNAKLMPDLPSGHIDKIQVTVIRNPSTQVNDVEQGRMRLDGQPAPGRSLRRGQDQIRGHPVPGRGGPEHLLLLDEHAAAALRRRQGPPGGQLRGRRRRRWNGSTPARSSAPSRSCRPACRATSSSTSTRTTSTRPKQLIDEADPTDRQITVWTDTESPNNEAGEYYEDVLEEDRLRRDAENPQSPTTTSR